MHTVSNNEESLNSDGYSTGAHPVDFQALCSMYESKPDQNQVDRRKDRTSGTGYVKNQSTSFHMRKLKKMPNSKPMQ